MAALTITKANVIAVAGSNLQLATAGATITAGQAIYLDATDSDKAKLCVNDGTAAQAACVGIALHDTLSGQPLRYISSGDLGLGAILTLGTMYVVGTVAGSIEPHADLVSTERATVIGVASTTSNLHMLVYATGGVIA